MAHLRCKVFIYYFWFQFHDGVYLVLLMGLLEGYFVPLFSFHLTPTNFEQKVRLSHQNFISLCLSQWLINSSCAVLVVLKYVIA